VKEKREREKERGRERESTVYYAPLLSKAQDLTKEEKKRQDALRLTGKQGRQKFTVNTLTSEGKVGNEEERDSRLSIPRAETAPSRQTDRQTDRQAQ